MIHGEEISSFRTGWIWTGKQKDSNGGSGERTHKERFQGQESAVE